MTRLLLSFQLTKEEPTIVEQESALRSFTFVMRKKILLKKTVGNRQKCAILHQVMKEKAHFLQNCC